MRVCASRLQPVIRPHQKTQERIFNQGATQRGFHTQFAPVKGPVEGPLEASGRDSPLQHLILEALTIHAQMGRGGRQ